MFHNQWHEFYNSNKQQLAFLTPIAILIMGMFVTALGPTCNEILHGRRTRDLPARLWASPATKSRGRREKGADKGGVAQGLGASRLWASEGVGAPAVFLVLRVGLRGRFRIRVSGCASAVWDPAEDRVFHTGNNIRKYTIIIYHNNLP